MDKSQIGAICKSASIKPETQEAALRKAGAQWIVTLGRVIPKTWRDILSVVREDDTVYVYGLALVPTKRGDGELPPSVQVREFIIEVHDRGGTVVEVSTGRNSRNRSQRQAMVKHAVKGLRRGNRSPRTDKPRGRPKTEWPDDVLAKAKLVWFSRDYQTNVIAEKHLPGGMTMKQAWTLFKASGRPYKKSKRSSSHCYPRSRDA